MDVPTIHIHTEKTMNNDTDQNTPDIEWGECLGVATVDGIPHIRVRATAVPEGVLEVYRCMRCGGIEEILFHLGYLDESDSYALKRLVSSAREDVNERWIPEHRDCGNLDDPSLENLPDRLREARRLALDQARQSIREGEPVPVNIVVLLAEQDGSDLVLPVRFDGIGRYNDRQRRRKYEREKARVRKKLQNSDVERIGALAVGEAWYVEGDGEHCVENVAPSRLPERKEALVLEVRSPDYTYVSFAPIRRHEAGAHEGPGELGEIRNQMVGAWSRLVDGLLATRRPRRDGLLELGFMRAPAGPQ